MGAVAWRAHDLTEAQRKRGLFAILYYVISGNLGFFLTVPLVVVHFVDNLGWPAGTVGFALAARLVVQQVLMLFGGAAADRFGPKALLIIGVLMRGLGFGLIGWADTPALLVAVMVLAGLGGAMGDAPRGAAIAHLTEEKQRRRFFGIMAIYAAVGTAVGPLVGVALLALDFRFATALTGGVYALTAIVLLFLLPRFPRPKSGEGHLLAGVGLALRHRSFMIYTALSIGFWFCAVQLTISVPLAATALGGNSSVSLVYLVSAALVMGLQYPVLLVVSRYLSPLASFAGGIGLMAAGLILIALASGVASLLLCIGVYTLGSMLANPNSQTVTAEFGTPATYGSYFGVAALAGALGGGLGQVAGGALYEVGQATGAIWLPWVIFGVAGMASAAGMALLSRKVGPELSSSR